MLLAKPQLNKMPTPKQVLVASLALIKFEFKTDGHWSPYGHSIVSEALIKKTREILNITE